MIDFRYHLVSIVAIFLALTVGIVLGATVLQNPIVETAQDTASRLEQSNAEYREQITALEQREEGNNGFVADETARLVGTLLLGERVVLVESPDAPGNLREAMEQVLAGSGAEVVGRISLTDKYVAPDQAALIGQVAASVKPPEMVFSADATPYDKAAAVLASAVVTADRTQLDKENPLGVGVLDSFQEAGLIGVDANPERRGTLALLLAPQQPYEGEDAAAQTAAIVSMASWLDSGGFGAVVTGTATAADAGGVITAVRDTGDVASRLSTVDTLDMPAGRVVVVYALREQLDGGAGEYGLGEGADAFQPSFSATPTPSPSTPGG